MIDSGGNTMCGRGCSKQVHDKAFIITMYREIHCPAIFGAPMPVEYILIALAIEIPIDIAPEDIDAFGKCLLFRRTIDVILVYSQ